MFCAPGKVFTQKLHGNSHAESQLFVMKVVGFREGYHLGWKTNIPRKEIAT